MLVLHAASRLVEHDRSVFLRSLKFISFPSVPGFAIR